MKKIHLIVYAILGIVYTNVLKAQDGPNIKFSGNKLITSYQKETDQDLSLTINYSPKDKDKPIYNVSIIAFPEGTIKPAFKIDPTPPYKLRFGKDYPTNYTVKITLLKDTTVTLPCLIKLIIKLDSTSKTLDSCTIFYQPGTELPKTTEAKLIKSTEDIRSDINTLKAQFLNGDTSRTYIGKFVIGAVANVVPHGYDIKSKMELEHGLTEARKESANTTEKVAKNAEKTKYLSTNIKPSKSPNGANNIPISQKAIDSIILTIREGQIEFIKVKLTDNSYYTNISAPISMLNIEKRFNDKLVNPVDGSYIFVKDAVNFEVEKRFNYFPSNGTFYLTNNKAHPKTEVKVFANNGLNTFVDLRIFTDLFGALDNKPNGLLQIEGKSRLYLHRSNVFNKFMYIFYGFEPYLGISKFDTKYDTIKIDNVKDTINRMNLFQRSFIRVGLKLNVFRWDFRPSNSIYINAGYQFNAGNISVRDSKNKADSIVATGILNTPYFEAGILGNIGANFGFEGEARIMFQQLNQNKYFTNSGYNRLMGFAVTGFFYPATKSKDRFFIRFSDNLNYSDRREDFYQLQFGYSLNFKL